MPSIKVWNKNVDSSELDLTAWTADIVSAYVAHHAVGGEKLPDFIGAVYVALNKASVNGVEPPKAELNNPRLEGEGL